MYFLIPAAFPLFSPFSFPTDNPPNDLPYLWFCFCSVCLLNLFLDSIVDSCEFIAMLMFIALIIFFFCERRQVVFTYAFILTGSPHWVFTHRDLPLCICTFAYTLTQRSGVSSSSYKDLSPISLVLHQFCCLNYLLKGSVSEYSHLGTYGVNI